MKESFKKYFKCLTTWMLRLVVAVTVLLFLFVLVSSFSAGNGPSQRRALQNVFAEFFGHPVFIHQLNNYQIFPSQEIDFQGLIVIKTGEQEPFFLVDRGVYFYQPFSFPWSDQLPLRQFWFTNLMTRPGIIGPLSLHFQEGKIVNGAEKTGLATFHITGKYGDVPIAFIIPMMLHDKKGTLSYQFDLKQKIQAFIGEQAVTFHIKIHKDVIELSDVLLQNDAERVYAISIPRHLKDSAERSFVVTDDKGKRFDIRFIEDRIDFGDISGPFESVLKTLFVQNRKM